VLTALGLAVGSLDGEMHPISQDAKSAALLDDNVFFANENSIMRVDRNNRTVQEYSPQLPKLIFAAEGTLFVDTYDGLYMKSSNGWVLARQRPNALPSGSTHVTAMTHFQNQLVIGTFDGGVDMGKWNTDSTSHWRPMPIANAWGINALLSYGNNFMVASLRGASRMEGNKLKQLEPSGAAFSLAQTPAGMAVGFGQGVLLPGGEFLSAFHGLPGNQALALLQHDYLYVGTPSGLGAISGNKVIWRTVAGDGLLPHPWVSALAIHKDALYIGTYGGGIVRRVPEAGQTKGRFEKFSETEKLKINTGCLAVFQGTLYLGTDGDGLYRLSQDGTRFEPAIAPLPSRNVTALLPDGEFLLVGTNEGIAMCSHFL
jgi:ligand-binding sensor domain-containing protein